MFKHKLIRAINSCTNWWILTSVLFPTILLVIFRNDPDLNFHSICQLYLGMSVLLGFIFFIISLFANNMGYAKWIANQKINPTINKEKKPLDPINTELYDKFKEWCENSETIKSFDYDAFEMNDKTMSDIKKYSQLDKRQFHEYYKFSGTFRERHTLIKDSNKFSLVCASHDVIDEFASDYGDYKKKKEIFIKKVQSREDYNAILTSCYINPIYKYRLQEFFIIFNNIVTPVTIKQARELQVIFIKCSDRDNKKILSSI